jgi:hypothetical protein
MQLKRAGIPTFAKETVCILHRNCSDRSAKRTSGTLSRGMCERYLRAGCAQ